MQALIKQAEAILKAALSQPGYAIAVLKVLSAHVLKQDLNKAVSVEASVANLFDGHQLASY